MKVHFNKKSGFTLIELLTTVAVIGVLAVLLLPALSKARKQAQSTACKNHLHQMGMALQMYVHDNENKYPHYLGPAGDAHGDETPDRGKAKGLVYWSSKLSPYYMSIWTNTAYHCPGYKGIIRGPYKDQINRLGSYAYNVHGVRSGKTYNAWGLGPISFWMKTPTTYVPAVSEADVKVPSEMLAMGDSLMKAGDAAGRDHWECNPATSSDRAALPYALRHGKSYNVLFCDGHVAEMLPEVLFDPAKTAAMWNYDHEPHPEVWSP
jgi:prepilin-type N-terminal cleavage/methylation domain-containing protein/prepilin-type processing-associated H-X9-DG protein